MEYKKINKTKKSLMCPCCFETNGIVKSAAITYDIEFNDNVEEIDDIMINHEIYLPEPRETIYIVCPVCGMYNEQLVIDSKLAEPIKLLNRKGYKTKFSCEGHIHGSSSTYIAFDESIDELKFKEGKMIDPTEYYENIILVTEELSEYNRFVIRSIFMNSSPNYDINNILEDIYNLIERLDYFKI